MIQRLSSIACADGSLTWWGPTEITRELSGALGVEIVDTGGTGCYNVAPGQGVLAIIAPDGQPLARMLFWTPASVGGEHIESCTMLTCDSTPNAVVHAIHRRMPVILPDADARRAWLDPSLDASEALSLCGALPADRMTVNRANPAVNKVDADREGPELLIPPPG